MTAAIGAWGSGGDGMSDRLSVLVILVAVGVWLVCLTAMVVREKGGGRTAFLIASAVVALVAFLLAPSKHAPQAGAAVRASSGGGCVAIHEGMTVIAVRDAVGEPASIVGEEDTQGPGAQALVYPGCVVHVLDGRVRTVDFEPAF